VKTGNAKQNSSGQCYRVSGDFPGRFQKCFTTAFSMAEGAFIDGKENPGWVGTDACKSDVRRHAYYGLLHLFDIDHTHCHHDKDWTSREGTVVTCPHQQKQLLWIADRTVFAVIDDMIVDGYGPINTNASEVVGSNALCFRRKSILLGSLHLLVKQLCTPCAVQALALARAGEIWNWRAELTELLEQDLTISGPERLLTAGMVQNWEDDLASRVNRSNKRRGEDYRKAQAKKRRIKQRHVEATRATKGRADSYNFDHDPNMWELWTAEKRKKEQSKQAPVELPAIKKCNRCHRMVRLHRTVNCPSISPTAKGKEPKARANGRCKRKRAPTSTGPPTRTIPDPESTAAPTNLLQQSFGSYDDYEVTSGPVVEAEIVTSDLLWFNG
jgi:hypothetical protein